MSVGLEPWLFTSLNTTLPVVPAGNSLNCLRSPVINNGRLFNALWDYVCLRSRVRNAYICVRVGLGQVRSRVKYPDPVPSLSSSAAAIKGCSRRCHRLLHNIALSCTKPLHCPDVMSQFSSVRILRITAWCLTTRISCTLPMIINLVCVQTIHGVDIDNALKQRRMRH